MYKIYEALYLAIIVQLFGIFSILVVIHVSNSCQQFFPFFVKSSKPKLSFNFGGFQIFKVIENRLNDSDFISSAQKFKF